jgi:hypothetical protein
MKLETQLKEISMSGTPFAQQEFTIKAGAHIMSVLSGLYKNPIQAIVREYLTNMNDAYVALFRETPDAEFIAPEIALPNALSPNLSFKDYGIGMSLETVFKVYTTYGESTKTGNNDETGGFGLGSKTAFCYNDGQTWAIESRFQGKKHKFSAFVGENGIPSIIHLSTSDTTEHSGVTVTVPIKSVDWAEVERNVKFFAPYFPRELKVLGAAVRKTDYVFEGKLWKMHRGNFPNARPYSYYNQTFDYNVVVGGVPYVIDFNSLPVHATKSAKYSVDIFLPVGDVDVVPSRDALKYSDKTKRALLNALDVADREIKEELQKYAKKDRSLWEQYVLTSDRNSLFEATVDEKIPTKLSELDPKATVTRLWYDNSYEATVRDATIKKDSEIDLRHCHIPVYSIGSNVQNVIIMDSKKFGLKQAITYFRKQYGKARRNGRYSNIQTSVFLIQGETDYSKITKAFNGLPSEYFIKASEILAEKQKEKNARVKKKKSEGVYTYNYGRWNIEENYLTMKDKPKYYITLEKVVGGPVPLRRCQFKNILNISYELKLEINSGIIGMTLDAQQKYGTTGMENIEDVIQTQLDTFLNKNLNGYLSMLWKDRLPSTNNIKFWIEETSKQYSKKYNTTLPLFDTFIKEWSDASLSREDFRKFSSLISLADTFKVPDVNKLMQSSAFDNNLKKLKDRYPMLEFLSVIPSYHLKSFIKELVTVIHLTEKNSVSPASTISTNTLGAISCQTSAV